MFIQDPLHYLSLVHPNSGPCIIFATHLPYNHDCNSTTSFIGIYANHQLITRMYAKLYVYIVCVCMHKWVSIHLCIHLSICKCRHMYMFRFMRTISCRCRLRTSFSNRKQKPKHPILSQGTLMFLIRSLSYMIIKQDMLVDKAEVHFSSKTNYLVPHTTSQCRHHAIQRIYLIPQKSHCGPAANPDILLI